MDCFLKIKHQYRAKKILILGLGIQGGGYNALDFFYRLGAKIRVSDLKEPAKLNHTLAQLKRYHSLQFEFGKHSAEFVKWADVVVRNPGVRIDSEVMSLAQKLGKEIIMPSAFLLKQCSFKSIGITGTRGKSTTTSLIYEILKHTLNSPVYLAGNMPQFSPFKIIPKVNDSATVVMELSSWELQGCYQAGVSPHLAVLTNIYPDHLNYYRDMADYIDDKMKIMANQQKTDVLVTLSSTLKQYPQIQKYVKGKLVVVEDSYYQNGFKFLIGKHNLANASLALKVSDLLRIPKTQAAKIIHNFRGLPYRLEYLGTIKQAAVYNDSTSTTPIAGIRAIQALQEHYPNKQILLIIGGNQKGLPFADWLSTVKQVPTQIFLLPGTFSDQIRPKLSADKVTAVLSLEELMRKIVRLLDKNKLVLFSPAATSFATFNNEFDRGAQFTQTFQEFLLKYGA